MMNYNCTSLASRFSLDDQLDGLNPNDDNVNNNFIINTTREHQQTSNNATRVGDLLKLTHLRLNDSQPDERQFHLLANCLEDNNTINIKGEMLSQRTDTCEQPVTDDTLGLVEHDDEPFVSRMDYSRSQQAPELHHQTGYEQNYGFITSNSYHSQPISHYQVKLASSGEQRFLSLDDDDFGPNAAQQDGFEFHLAEQVQPAGVYQARANYAEAGQVSFASRPQPVRQQDAYKSEVCVYTSLDANHYGPCTGAPYLVADCAPSLPEPVLKLNYLQQQQQQQAQVQVQANQLQCSQCQFQQHQEHLFQQMPAHQRASSSAQSEPASLLNPEVLSFRQHQQADSGHVSCIDSQGSEANLLVSSSGSYRPLNGSTSFHRPAIVTMNGSTVVHPTSCNSQLDEREQEEEEEPELKLCEWEGCENTFLDMGEFVRHLEERHVNQAPREKNRYYCLWSNCKRNEQEFNARYKLLIHMRVHSGEKPYPCSNDNCKKSFSRLENLKIHVRSHTGEKPYKCNFDNCSKSFTNSSDRIKHHKTHRDPKPYSCSYAGCAKRYTDPSSLRKHLRAHKRSQLDTTGVSTTMPLSELEPVCAQSGYDNRSEQQQLHNGDHFDNQAPGKPTCGYYQHESTPFQGQQRLLRVGGCGDAHERYSRSWCATSDRPEHKRLECSHLASGRLANTLQRPDVSHDALNRSLPQTASSTRRLDKASFGLGLGLNLGLGCQHLHSNASQTTQQSTSSLCCSHCGSSGWLTSGSS